VVSASRDAALGSYTRGGNCRDSDIDQGKRSKLPVSEGLRADGFAMSGLPDTVSEFTADTGWLAFGTRAAVV